MTTRKTLETVRLEDQEYAIRTSARCYPIAPIEFGNELSEGCSSYFVRLCAAHKLLPIHFLKSVLFARDEERAPRAPRAYPRTHLATVNGMGPVAQYVVTGLTDLTGVQELRFLTALPWAGMLDPKGNHLLKKTRAWCPVCYQESSKTGLPFFDSLYASFRIVSLCVRHLTPLCDKCPKCGANQPFVPHLPFLEHCCKCGHHLGEPKDYHGLIRRSRQREEVWFTGAVADLIKATIHYQDAISLDTFSGKLSRILVTHAGGKHSVLARQVGLPPYHLVNWLTKGYRPGFPLFLDLCRRLNCPPSSFLFESDELTHPDFWIKEKPKVYVSRTPRTEREIKLMRALINAIAESTSGPPKSLKQAAKELGCSPAYLAMRFPDEVTRIRARFKSYRETELGRRKAEREGRIRLALANAISKGISTSERSLKSHELITPRDTRRPEFNEIKREILGQI